MTWWPLVLCPGFMRWTVAALLSMIPERGFAVQVVNGCGFPLVDLPSSWRAWRGLPSMFERERLRPLSSMIPEPWPCFVNYCCGALPSRIQGVAVVVAGEFQR